MELGEKLRKARLEAGLSQRELCAGEITRNMLSQIENGSARPSMKTLVFFAQRLGKPVSYFLEETAVLSPNTQIIADARQHFDEGNWEAAVQALEGFRQGDEVYGRERDLLWAWSHLALARQALSREQVPYALQLLQQTEILPAYCAQALTRERLLLLGKTGQRVSEQLPTLDDELLLRAEEAADSHYAAALLDAAQDRESPRWNLLRGNVWLADGKYAEAVQCFHKAEEAYPRQTTPKLELCYKEMGDFRKAYEYACKGR